MVQSVLANLGILLLMHLMINTLYHFQQQRKISRSFVPLFHILIVTAATMAMFHYPIKIEHHLFDLRLIPIIFIAFFHGWRFALPVVILASIYRYFLGGEGTGHEIILGIIIPSILPMFFYPQKVEKLQITKAFVIITACWFISDITVFSLIDNGILIFAKVALFRYLSLILAALIMYFFIYTGIRHLELVKKLKYLADHDQLTGLYNMRKFEEIIAHFVKMKQNKQMFIAMVDIDRFKPINDTYGHQAGDQAIKSIANIMLHYCSKNVYAARYGGDEFILFLMTDSINEAETILESIRVTIAETTIVPIGSKQSCKLSISVGISPFTNREHLNASIEQADKQLYLAKQSGKNCICG